MAPKHYCAKKSEPERSYEEKTQDCQRWKTRIGVNFTFDEIEKSWFFFSGPWLSNFSWTDIRNIFHLFLPLFIPFSLLLILLEQEKE